MKNFVVFASCNSLKLENDFYGVLVFANDFYYVLGKLSDFFFCKMNGNY